MKKRFIIPILFVLAIVVVALFARFWEGAGTAGTFSGTVFLYNERASILSVEKDGEGERVLVSVDLSDPSLVFVDEGQNSFILKTLRRGFPVTVSGFWQGEDALTASKIVLARVPNIIVYTPEVNTIVTNPFVLVGEARVFENTFNYRIKDESGAVLGEGFDTAQASDVGVFGPFSVLVFYEKSNAQKGTLEVFTHSAMDGSEIEKVTIPLLFKNEAVEETTTIALYWGSTAKDPNTNECEKTYPVTRTVPKTITPARTALDLLLAGPTEEEKKAGYFSSIPSGVSLKSITIEKNIARVDFAKTNWPTGGSCLVSAVRSEIENTLKQFSTVKEVSILVEGKTEGVLEP